MLLGKEWRCTELHSGDTHLSMTAVPGIPLADVTSSAAWKKQAPRMLAPSCSRSLYDTGQEKGGSWKLIVGEKRDQLSKTASCMTARRQGYVLNISREGESFWVSLSSLTCNVTLAAGMRIKDKLASKFSTWHIWIYEEEFLMIRRSWNFG